MNPKALTRYALLYPPAALIMRSFIREVDSDTYGIVALCLILAALLWLIVYTAIQIWLDRNRLIPIRFPRILYITSAISLAAVIFFSVDHHDRIELIFAIPFGLVIFLLTLSILAIARKIINHRLKPTQ